MPWCSKCGGYAVRRLTHTQLSYYRAAHRLHDVVRQLDGGRGNHETTDISKVISHLEELAAWQPIDEEEWCTSDSWRWRDTVRELRRKADKALRHDAP